MMDVRTQGKVPRWAMGLLGREVEARMERLNGRRMPSGPISVRWMKCGRGCEHGRAFPWRNHIRIYASGSATADKYLLIHELAHLTDPKSGHGPTFYRHAIRIARREGCLRGFLTWQGRMAKAEYRRMLAEERQPLDAVA